MKAYTTLLTEREGALLTITLNRPEKLHALNDTMFGELEDLFTAVREDAALRVVIVTGSGERAFAAGADIGGLAGIDTTQGGEDFSQRGQRVFSLMEQCGKPVIACINGAALGGGCELALACTLRIASEKAKLGLPEVKLGLVPGYGGTQRLPRLIGGGNALRMMLTGEFVSAQEALRVGLVQEVVAPEALMERGRELARVIAAQAPLAVAGAMEAVRRGEGETLDTALAVEREIFGRLCATEDKREGVGAFLEKRAATFSGR